MSGVGVPRRMGVGVPARQMMTMRATTLRPVAAGTDGYGHDLVDSKPDVWIDSMPCRAWSPSDVREVLDGSKDGVFGAVRIVAPLGVDIAEGDTVTQIVDRRGRVVFDGPLSVTAVTRRASHLAVMARVQRGAAGGV